MSVTNNCKSPINPSEPIKYTVLESFAKERERYKPKDLIDFTIEYFKCLQSNTPMDYKDLSGLDKFSLQPEDSYIIKRLEIPSEDLVRVKNRRKNIKHEDKLKAINDKICEYLERSSKGPLTDDEMHYYLKFKKNTFTDNEFLRFLDGLENLQINTNDKRIYYTKLFNLSQADKDCVFNFLKMDIEILKNKNLNSWKTTLEILDASNKHTYAPYDSVSIELEKYIQNYEKKNEKISLIECKRYFEEKYLKLIEEIKNLSEKELYFFMLKNFHFKRVNIYDILKIKMLADDTDKAELENLFKNYEKIFKENFEYLTPIDFYDFILCNFIPLIKVTEKTSQEFREMESFLNKFLSKIPFIYNNNFEEEKNLYYNHECIKYFLNKANKIKTTSFKKLFIEIINNLANKVKELRVELGLKTLKDLQNNFEDKFELIKLQFNEFYPELVNYTHKIIGIAVKYNMGSKNYEIQNSLISEYKSYEKLDQILITSALSMFEMFEVDPVKQKGIHDTIIVLVKAMSIKELADKITKNEDEEISEEIVPKKVVKFYKDLLKEPAFEFNNLKYLTFKNQTQLTSLISKEVLNKKNSAIIYEKDFITPYLNYDFMIETLFNFDVMYFKLCFNKMLKEDLDKQILEIEKNLFDKYTKEKDIITKLKDIIIEHKKEFKAEEEANRQGAELKTKLEDLIKEFTTDFNKFQQKLILTYLNFYDDLHLEKLYEPAIQILSIIYLEDKVSFLERIYKTNITNDQKALYLECLHDEMKHVNYSLYVYIKYERSNELLVKFTKEEKEVIQRILNTINPKNKFILPECMSYSEMQKTDQYDELISELEKLDPVVFEYIKNYQNDEENFRDFKIFHNEEREIIIKVLSHKYEEKFIEHIKNYHMKNKDHLYKNLKQIMLCETDLSLDNLEGLDIRFYYHKKLMYNEKNINDKVKECISLIMDYTFDPNNQYLKNDFMNFEPENQMILLLDILIRMKILDTKTLYYEQLSCVFMENYLKNYIEMTKRRNKNPAFMARIQSDFDFLIKFYDKKLLSFIKEVNNFDVQSLFKFLTNFSESERKVITLFLEFYGAINNNLKYENIKKEFENYLTDLTYKERINYLKENLHLILQEHNENLRHIFIIYCEMLKETALEVDYIIEKLTSDNEQELNIAKYIFNGLDTDLKEIVVSIIKIMLESRNDPKIKDILGQLESSMYSTQEQSLFENIRNMLEDVDGNVSPSQENVEYKEKYDKIRETFSIIASDLFTFVDDCIVGKINMRKIKAVSKIKVEIIKLMLSCECAFRNNPPKLVQSRNIISLIKFEY